MEKIKRNDLCPCGSGLKYKKCCMIKEQENNTKPQMKVSDVLGFVKFGLENLNILSKDSRKVKTKEIKLLGNNSLECQIYPYNNNSIDIKLEIGTIMGFFSGFFKDDSFKEVIDIKYFAVRAYDNNDKEILYAISSKESAKLISNGNSIDWLKSTIFQENTADYRLSVAKRQISEIEKSLRYAIVEILSKKYGENWWNKSVGNKLSSTVKKMYKEQYGEEIENGIILIKYTFLLHLKKVICTNWKDFKHLFDSKIIFENYIDDLNFIRKEEAHNREITEQHLSQLNLIYNTLLKNITELYPKLIPEYLIDNWRFGIKEIMNNVYQPLFEEDITQEKDMQKKLINSTLSILHQISYLKNTEEKLNSLIVPVQKRNIHNRLVNTFVDYRKLQEKLIEYAKNKDLEKLEMTFHEMNNYKKEMDSFTQEFLLKEG